MNKRAYRSPLREEQARATRERILDAALALFETQGYGATSISTIAREAGVVPETIYASLGSKRGIIDGLIGRVAPSQFVDNVVADWVAAGGDPVAQLGVIAQYATGFWERNERLAAVLRQGTGDADIAGEWKGRQTARRGLYAKLLADWPPGTIRSGLPFDGVIDVVWVLTSDAVFDLLVRDQGWSAKRYETWLRGALEREVLRAAASTDVAGR